MEFIGWCFPLYIPNVKQVASYAVSMKGKRVRECIKHHIFEGMVDIALELGVPSHPQHIVMGSGCDK